MEDLMQSLLYTCAFREEDGAWTAIVLDMPGVVTEADTFEAARDAAQEALALHVAAMREDGAPVPAPRPLADLVQDPDLANDRVGAVLVQLAAPPPPARVVRVQLTMDEGLLAKVDAAARARGDSRSGFLAEGARRLIADA
jgi:predicted RNase H-like HicB family nuclease